MIKIQEGRYFSAIWFIPGPSVDWMAALYRDEENDNRLTLTCRFRYYEDSEAFHSKDRKTWTEGAFKEPQRLRGRSPGRGEPHSERDRRQVH